MKTTNVTELKEFYANAFTSELYENIKVSVSAKEKKSSDTASISIKMQVDEKKSVTGTLYIVDKEKTTYVLFVSDKTHDIIFNNFSVNSIEKSKKYVVNYFERSIKKILGIEIEKGTDDKKESVTEK